MTDIPLQHPIETPEHRESRSLKGFFISAMLAMVLVISAGFLGMVLKDRQLIREEMLHRAQRDFQNIVLTRHWNAQYGGVYVEKKPGVVSNPYLENPDITALDGRVLTKKNPALMTRELSGMMDQAQGYTFHITSLKPLNPANHPDSKEAEALRAFEDGLQELTWTEERAGQAYFRYMAPLRTDQSCLSCHAIQGYHVGDVRGGISVSFQVSDLQLKLRRNLFIVLGLATLTILLLVGTVTVLFWHLVVRLREAREALKILAATDVLTGLLNRRSIFLRLEEELERHRRSGEPLSCALLDLDHFKQVNDSLGHQAGDLVLQQVGQTLRSTSRTYDVVGRYGGEEFILVLAHTDLGNARVAVERIREALEVSVRAGDALVVTASFGIAQWKPGETMTDLLSRADRATYLAKANGRNRVEVDTASDT